MVFDRRSEDLVFFRRQGLRPGFFNALLAVPTLLFLRNATAFASGGCSLARASNAHFIIKTKIAARSSVPLIPGPRKYKTSHLSKTHLEIGIAAKQRPGSEALLPLHVSGFDAPYIFEVAEGNIR